MSYTTADFQNEIAINAKIDYANTNVKAYLTLMATALGSDTTTHDTTIEEATGVLQPGWSANDRYQNDIALIINKGKAGI